MVESLTQLNKKRTSATMEGPRRQQTLDGSEEDREPSPAESEQCATEGRAAVAAAAVDDDDDGKIIFNYGWWLGSVKERSVATRRGRCRVRSELPKTTSENKRVRKCCNRGKALLSGSNDGAGSWSCDFL